MNLANQVALITGAGQGIDKASALALAEAGAHVVVADIARQHADATTEAMMSRQLRALAVQADVGDLRDIDRMIRETLNTFGQIDILVNNAGVTRRADIMDPTEADWDRIHRVNAKGVFFCLQRVAREVIRQGWRRADHQHHLDRRQRLCRYVERRLRRELGRGDLPDQDRGAATGQI